jgi:3-oxoacyl-[acyl-carrier protein] reductase
MQERLRADFSLEGRLAVIVGAGSGIGREAAGVFAEAGAHLLLADRDADGLSGTVDVVRRRSLSSPSIMTVDVRDRSSVDELGRMAAARGGPDIWVNVAGIISRAAVTDLTEEDLDQILAVNLKGTLWGCAAAARAMKPRKQGAVINISSSAADQPLAEIAAYAMSKSAVNMLTRTLATELGPDGIRVNAIAPGFVHTPLVERRFIRRDGTIDDLSRDAHFASRAAEAALNRIGSPRDVALAMLYLASDAGAFVTGQILRPNGGSVMP